MYNDIPICATDFGRALLLPSDLEQRRRTTTCGPSFARFSNARKVSPAKLAKCRRRKT